VGPIQSCSGAAKDCLGQGGAVTGKPKKLLGAYNKCAAKAIAGKTCKATCGQ
jgi:hypothetical protein